MQVVRMCSCGSCACKQGSALGALDIGNPQQCPAPQHPAAEACELAAAQQRPQELTGPTP